MEVVAPRSPDFHFSNAGFSPYPSAPSSPVPFGDWSNHQYFVASAPASPIHYTVPASLFDPPVSHRSREKGGIQPPRIPTAPNSSRSARRKSRSLSPSREQGLLAKSGSPSANPVKCGLSRKWPRLKDLLLFRSASEGRATARGSKDPLRKYAVLPAVALVSKRGAGEDKKAGGGETARVRGSRPAVSAHEKHYTANRAAAEEQKRRTPLPFPRHGLLGFVDFSPAIGGKGKLASSPKGRF